MRGFLQDLRHAARAFRARPLFSAVAIAILATGIAASTLMFTVADSLLWRPFPYDPDSRVVTVLEVERGRRRSPTSPANFRDWQAAASLEAMTAAHPWSPTLTGRERAERLVGLKASPSLFTLLHARPLLGTTFSPNDVARESRVVVLSHDLWQRTFGGERSIVGRTLVLDAEPYTVVGVMPPGFSFPPFWHTRAAFWAPLVFTPEQAGQRGARMLRVFAKLREGRTLEEAQSEMRVIQARLAREYPRENTEVGVEVEPLLEPAVGDRRATLLALLGAVGFVLLIACANVASLLLARASVQESDWAVRQALGAGTWRLVRQQLAHGVVLASAGGALGVLLAWWGLGTSAPILSERLPRGQEIALDGRALAVTFAVLSATALLVSLLPALVSARVDVVARLRAGGERGATSRIGLRRWIVAGQLALAFTLLVGTGLMLRSVWRLQSSDPGFSRDHVLTMTVSLPKEPYRDVRRQAAWIDEAQRQVATLPGVQHVGFVNHLPVGGDTWGTAVAIEGEPPANAGAERHASYRSATPGYFAALGMRLAAGRDFAASDTPDSAPVGIVNERFVREHLGGANPLGRRVALTVRDEANAWITIVGVVRDALQVSLRDELAPEIFLPHSQNPVAWFTSVSAVVRTTGDPLAPQRAVEQALTRLEPDAPIGDVRSMEQVLDATTAGTRFNAWLLTAFGAMALFLACVGLYGAIDYSVGLRRREFGIRMALGATRAAVVGTVLREAFTLVAAGGAVGFAGALLLSRVLESALYGVSSTDAVTYFGGATVVAATALVAALAPAVSAGRLDPARALRDA